MIIKSIENHIHGDHQRSIRRPTFGQHEHDIEYLKRSHRRHQNNRGEWTSNKRHQDMLELLPAICAINFSGIKIYFVNPIDGRDKNYHAETISNPTVGDK